MRLGEGAPAGYAGVAAPGYGCGSCRARPTLVLCSRRCRRIGPASPAVRPPGAGFGTHARRGTRSSCLFRSLLSPALLTGEPLPSGGDSGVPDERGEQLGPAPQGRKLLPQPGPQFPGAFGAVVRQAVVLGVIPVALVRVGLRLVAGELLGPDLEVLGQVLLHDTRPLMDSALVPEDRQRPPDLVAQLGREGGRILPMGVGAVRHQLEVESG